MEELGRLEERVILIGVQTAAEDNVLDSLDELEELAETAGAVTVGRIIQNREAVHPGTYIGKGKIEEVRSLVYAMDATGVICDDELSPAQLNNLERELDCKVMDRTLLILDIFAARAVTSEGKIQVELAQLRYRSARLVGLRESLSRLGGGIGTRGPGEKKLETDRRLIRTRISALKQDLAQVEKHRELLRTGRARGKVKTAAIVGYTNAGKSTLMSVLFGLYQPEEGEIRKNGKKVDIQDPNDANELGIGMVHQHFKLVECFSVLDNIMLGVETTTKGGFLKKDEVRKKVVELSEKYGLSVDPDAKIENITVGMQQRTEILKMLYRDNEVLIFDEPTAVLTPQEINELMVIMKNLAAEGKSILFITHKLAEIMAVADRCSVLRKGKYIGTVDIKDTTPEKLSAMMVGRDVNFVVDKKPAKTGDVVLSVRNMTVASKQHKNNAVNHVSFDVRRGEIVCIAGIDGNGQSELVYGLSGLEPVKEGTITMNGQDITNMPIRRRITSGMSHIPEDRHKHGLVLDYSLEDNIVLERYFEPQFTNRFGFLKRKEIRKYANRLIKQYDIRSGQGPVTKVRSMSGGNQQKAIIAREIDKDPKFLIAVQPTRGLDVGAIEYIHKQIVAERDAGKGVLLVSLELDEVMNVSDRILVMYEGEIVGEFDPKKVSVEELGLYMAGSKRKGIKENG